MAIQTSFTKKMTGSHNCNHCFLALLRKDGELDLALLNIKDRVRSFSLGENNLILPVRGHGLSLAYLGEEFFGIKYGFDFLPHRGLPFSFSQGPLNLEQRIPRGH